MADAADSGIYEIVNQSNGKRYIGSAKCFAVRWRAHRAKLRKGRHANRHLQAAWMKYGEEQFSFRPILLCSVGELIEREQSLIDNLRPEYNLSPTAGSTLGTRFSPEARARLSIAMKGKALGRKRDPESVAKGATAHRGMRRSEVTRANISAAKKGTPRSLEAVEKSASKLRGRRLAPDRTAHLIGNTHALGRRDTDEQRAAKSARQMGRKCPRTPEHSAKLSAALKGRKHSAEQCAAKSARQLGKKRGPYRRKIAAEPSASD